MTKKNRVFKVGEVYQCHESGPAFRVEAVTPSGGFFLRALTTITGYVLTADSNSVSKDCWRGPLGEVEVREIETKQRREAREYLRKKELGELSSAQVQKIVRLSGRAEILSGGEVQ